MKTFFTTCALLLSTASFASYSLEDIAGTYKASQPVFEVSNLITIDSSGEVSLTETSPMGVINCTGMASIEGDLVSSQMSCENGTEYTQTINLAEVESVKTVFTAPVYSSLFNQEIPFVFEPVEEKSDVLTFATIAGKYEVSHPMMGVVNYVTIDTEGKIDLVESSGAGDLKCSGQATLVDGVIESEVLCENQLTFTQKIDLTNVTNFDDEFAASVYTSLIGREVILSFKKLEVNE